MSTFSGEKSAWSPLDSVPSEPSRKDPWVCEEGAKAESTATSGVIMSLRFGEYHCEKGKSLSQVGSRESVAEKVLPLWDFVDAFVLFRR